MDVYEVIKKRRTTRDFSDYVIDNCTIKKIIEAGLMAPSNDHMRDWHFIVLNDINVYSDKIQYNLNNDMFTTSFNIINIYILKRWSDDNTIKLVPIKDKLHRETLLHRYIKGIDGVVDSFDRLLQNNTFLHIIKNASFSYLYLPQKEFLGIEVNRICKMLLEQYPIC